MHRLELKVPPVAVALLIAVAMWWMSLVSPPYILPVFLRAGVAGALAIAGVLISVAGVESFRQVRTTVNPTRPGSTSVLVTSGIYSLTRNPMYLGFLLILLGWGAFLASVLAFAGAVIFVLYMNRFQIRPEEQAMSTLFGEQYDAYRSEVRRWL